MNFRIQGLSPDPFRALYGQPDDVLRAARARRVLVDSQPGFPDRIEMYDMAPGTSALLVNYTHLAGETPYRASHAVFVREGAATPYDQINVVPDMLERRLLSVRAFDGDDMLIDADITEGSALVGLITRLLSNDRVDYLHAHFARQGCYAARITRA